MLKLILILKITGRVTGQAVFAAALLLTACTGKPGKPDSGAPPPLPDGGMAVSRAAVVSAAADCAIVSAKEFHDAAELMKSTTATLAASPDATTLAAAREAFHVAFDAWQVNEVLQFGPAAPSNTPGGGDLRVQIDPWPMYDRCGVESHLVAKSYESGVRSLLITRRGMPTLEYLLFYERDDTACAAGSPIVAQGTWAALSHDERAARRRAYAAAVASDVYAWSTELVAQWNNGFKSTMTTAGSGSALFASPQAALNVVSDAAFYVEVLVKDTKLARPLGLRECTTPTCPEQLESLHAGRSKRNIARNLVGFRRLMEGCEANHAGIGFDDLLAGVGAGATAEKIVLSTNGIAAALAAIHEPDLKEALVADRASVQALYDATKALTDVMKTDFITVLDLDLPVGIETDND